MQAIITKYHGPTNFKGSRYSAECDAGRVTISAIHELDSEGNHIAACLALRTKIAQEQVAKYGSPIATNPWMRLMVCGQLPNGNYAHVFASTK